jgi:hypothetical protein
MKGWLRLIAAIAALLGVLFATWAVLLWNLNHGVYPTDADTIIIPIAHAVGRALLVLPALVVLAVVPPILQSRLVASKWKVLRVTLWVLVVLSYLLGLLVGADGVSQWLIPNHYLLAASHGVFILVILWLLQRNWAMVRSNISLQADRER